MDNLKYVHYEFRNSYLLIIYNIFINETRVRVF